MDDLASEAMQEFMEHTTKKLQLIQDRLDYVAVRMQTFDQHQRTIMVGWNGFLEHAGLHLNNLFRGKVPAPILRKLLEASFRDESKHAQTKDK